MNHRASSRPWLAALALVVIASCALGEGRRLGTIGPPPRQDPQRQTSSEGVPPLPLPATPMRRSEPKAEPSPPVFIAKLMYGDTQDYTPNRGDLDNLLRHVRSALDVWYGHQMISIDELVTMAAGGEPCRIPMLYITGYQPFAFSAEQREALRAYLLDGGTLVGDATLGSPAFAASFRREVGAMFPRRKLTIAQPDHPLLRSYFQAPAAQYFAIDRGAAAAVKGPPVLEIMNLAARTAVVLSPYDLTCGWDGFYAPPAEARVPDAPRTRAMMPQDAVRIGINLIAYVAAERRFGQAQAATRHIQGRQPHARAALPIAILRHHGDWNPDPNSLLQLVRLAALRTSVPVDYELRPVEANIDQLVETPLVIMTGMDEPRFSEDEIDALRRHIQAGGFLFINNTSGFALFDREVRSMVERMLPDHALDPVPDDHPLLTGLYHIDGARDAATSQRRAVELEAVFVDGRAVVVYSRHDTLAMLKGIHDPYANAYDADSARKLALNVVSHALRR